MDKAQVSNVLKRGPDFFIFLLLSLYATWFHGKATMGGLQTVKR